MKIRVGQYQDGRDRFELRHFNDLKLAHPDSAASPVSRPKLGRPPTSSSEASKQTEVTPTKGKEDGRNRFSGPDGPPPLPPFPSHPPQQTNPRRENSNATSRPVRTTRNPAPQYIDSVGISWSTRRPWSASQSDIAALNQSISRNFVPPPPLIGRNEYMNINWLLTCSIENKSH